MVPRSKGNLFSLGKVFTASVFLRYFPRRYLYLRSSTFTLLPPTVVKVSLLSHSLSLVLSFAEKEPIGYLQQAQAMLFKGGGIFCTECTPFVQCSVTLCGCSEAQWLPLTSHCCHPGRPSGQSLANF